MDLKLEGNVVLTTGSSAGLGAAIAEAFARENATVVICGRTEEKLTGMTEKLESIGQGEALGVRTDLTVLSDVEHLVETTIDEFGGIDHVVTSTGGPPGGSLSELSDDDWYYAFDLLVMSAVRTIRTALPALQESDYGTVVAVSSRSTLEVVEDLILSTSVRRAVNGFCQTVARTHAPEVRANVVLPGPHETDRLESVIREGVQRGEFDSYEEGVAARSEAVPLGIGNTTHFGDVVAFLSSQKADFISGAEIPIDGGWHRS